MKIALAQQHASTDRDRNVERAAESVRAAGDRGADLVVFPELAVDRFFPARPGGDADGHAEPVPGPTTDRMARAAEEAGTVVVFNLYEEDDRGRRFDSSPVIDADGELLGVTRMVHITDFEGFHEQDYYDPGDRGAPVYDTAAGRLGVAICYDRHYPEYMRALGVAGAEIVAVPQAGVVGEWPEGLYEAELRVAAFQNGYWAALCNRVGVEGDMTFAGESFVVDPEGRVVARAERLVDDLLVVDVEPGRCRGSTARRLFWRDRRPDLYGDWLGPRESGPSAGPDLDRPERREADADR
jgi:N-carbamoylputrescine amidase